MLSAACHHFARVTGRAGDLSGTEIPWAIEDELDVVVVPERCGDEEGENR